MKASGSSLEMKSCLEVAPWLRLLRRVWAVEGLKDSKCALGAAAGADDM